MKNQTQKRNIIPYMVTAFIIVILAVVIVVIVGGRDRSNRESDSTTKESPTYYLDGGIPYYSDVKASVYPAENYIFDEDTSRISYADKEVSYYTGIDVSSHNGDIDWEKVADDGISFAVARIGFRGYGEAGNICEDEKCEENIEGALAAGLKVGVYFYSQAISVEEAQAEAKFVTDILEKYDIEYPVVFDWENEPGVNMRTDNLPGEILTDCAVAFCEAVKEKGYTPAIYFNLSDAYARYNLSKIKDYPFWFAQHEGGVPSFYYNYDIWQYSDSGSVDGIDGNVDLNISFIEH